MHEPTVTLPSGVAVLQAVVEWLEELAAAGYVVAIDEDDDVTVTPELENEDILAALNHSRSDVRAILEHTARVH